jgi:hypothetical protein
MPSLIRLVLAAASPERWDLPHDHAGQTRLECATWEQRAADLAEPADAKPHPDPPLQAGEGGVLLVPGCRSERGGNGADHGCVSSDFGKGHWGSALPVIDKHHERPPLSHHDAALVTG